MNFTLNDSIPVLAPSVNMTVDEVDEVDEVDNVPATLEVTKFSEFTSHTTLSL